MTEWERDKEREEFTKAAKLYKPLIGLMAHRFTTAKYLDEVDKADIPDETVIYCTNLVIVVKSETKLTYRMRR